MLHNEARKLLIQALEKTHNAREVAENFSVNRGTVQLSSYYKVVVIRVPLQGQNATIDKVLWIGLNLLPQDGFGKAPTTALCF